MKYALVGATGATGSKVLRFLLDADHEVNIIVRSRSRIPEDLLSNPRLNVTEASLLDLSDKQLQAFVKDCDAVASCLGHNLTFKGIYGKPRKLVRDSVRRLSEAISANQPERKVRFILMSTSGYVNKDQKEKISIAERMVIGLLRILLPPHPDNEQAGEHFRKDIGRQHRYIEWSLVRPDTLIDEDELTDYELYNSPITSALFRPMKTSRVNVAHFISKLMTSDIFEKCRFEMPVIYNKLNAQSSSEQS